MYKWEKIACSVLDYQDNLFLDIIMQPCKIGILLEI